MLLLFSMVAGPQGGIQGVNRLVLEAVRARGLPAAAVALHDPVAGPDAGGLPVAAGAGGSRLRFVLAALARRGAAAGSTVFATHARLAPVGRLVRPSAGSDPAARSRLVVFLHGVEVWGPLAPLTRWGLCGSDLLIANSGYTLQRFRAAHPDLAHLPGEVCPLPARALAAGDPGPDLPRPPLRVLTVGRLWGRGMRKGQKELIDLWPRVLRRFPGAELWIVGGGAGRAELEARARRCGVAGAVVFTGEVSDARLARLYAASDLYAMPSWGEGFGLVFAEAMAHGLPCLASRLDAGAEVVAEGETGLLVDPEDAGELWAALERLLGDAELRARLGEAGRRRARDLYSVERFQARLAGLLEGVERA